MNFENYKNLGLRLNKANYHKSLSSHDTFDLFIDSPRTPITDEDFIKIYCSELKAILNQDNIRSMAVLIFELDKKIKKIITIHADDFVFLEELPSLESLYRALSPLFLQTFIEIFDNDCDESLVAKGWLEALRISIEEEIYIWQEKI